MHFVLTFCVVMAFSNSSSCPVFFNFFTRLFTAFSHHFSSCPFCSPFFQPRSLFTIGGVNGNMDILNVTLAGPWFYPAVQNCTNSYLACSSTLPLQENPGFVCWLSAFKFSFVGQEQVLQQQQQETVCLWPPPPSPLLLLQLQLQLLGQLLSILHLHQTTSAALFLFFSFLFFMAVIHKWYQNLLDPKVNADNSLTWLPFPALMKYAFTFVHL